MPLLAQKCSVWTHPVSPNRALTVVSKQPLNNAQTGFQFGGQTLVPNHWNQTAVFGSKSVHLETGRIRRLAVRARQRRDHHVTVIAGTP